MLTPKVLISEDQIKKRVKELGTQINQDYQGKELVAICVLNGSFIFFSDILRELNLSIDCEFLSASSYGDRKVSSGEVKITLDIHSPLENKHVILFEDIIDSGLTLSYIQNNLKTRNPSSLKTCALLIKPECLIIPAKAEYLGFEIGNEFVVGYGMDLAGKYRGLPYVGYL